MPRFTFIDTTTQEESYEYMSSGSKEKFLLDNPNLQETFTLGAPAMFSGRGTGKPDEGFRDVLREIKKKHSQGFTKSTVNTF